MDYSIPVKIMEQVDISSLGLEDSFNDVVSSVARSVEPIQEKDLPDPIDYLKKIMAERGLRNKDLKIYIGSSGNVCSVLKRKKPLTLRMIRNLHKYLSIPAEILIQPYDCH